MYPITPELIRIIHEENIRAALARPYRWPSERATGSKSVEQLRHAVASALRRAAAGIDPRPAPV
jgi:hypothetical protein